MNRAILILCIGFILGSCKQQKETVIRMETSLGNIRVKLYDETVLHRDNMVKLIQQGFYDGILFHRVIRDFMIQAGDPASRGARSGVLLGDKDAGYTIPAEILPQYFHKRGVLAAAREGDNINPERNSSGSHFYIVQGKVYTPEGLEEAVENINNKRFTALFNQLKAGREGEIARYQLVNDYENLMRINRELSDTTRTLFEDVKLKLSEEQKKAYTTAGGTPHLDGEYTVYGEVIEGMEVVDQIASRKTDDYCRPEEDIAIRKIVVE